MSITDELREYARIHQPYKSELYNAQCADEITAIADRIDAEHEREVTIARGEAVTELGHKVVSEYVKLRLAGDGE